MNTPQRISVLVVDDSPVVRQVLTRLLLEDPAIGSVDTAPNASVALRKIHKHDPDVVTMDVNMPGMDGLAALEGIMTTSPRPVLMVSALTQEGAEKTLRALSLGAIDFISKPDGRLSRDIAQIGIELREKVRAVAPLKVRFQRRARHATCSASSIPPPPIPAAALRRVSVKKASAQVIGIGASTGGTDAILQLLSRLPTDFPVGILIVQHMPPGFTLSFARRLNDLTHLDVKEAQPKDLVLPGRALLAPGHSHMIVRRGELGAYVDLEQGPEVSGHRPSVDVLFDSIAEQFGARSIAALLTGMGRDGASGMRHLRAVGAETLAQDEKSSVVFGMPKAAIQEGSVSLVASPGQLGDVLTHVEYGDPPQRPKATGGTLVTNAEPPSNNRPQRGA